MPRLPLTCAIRWSARRQQADSSVKPGTSRSCSSTSQARTQWAYAVQPFLPSPLRLGPRPPGHAVETAHWRRASFRIVYLRIKPGGRCALRHKRARPDNRAGCGARTRLARVPSSFGAGLMGRWMGLGDSAMRSRSSLSARGRGTTGAPRRSAGSEIARALAGQVALASGDVDSHLHPGYARHHDAEARGRPRVGRDRCRALAYGTGELRGGNGRRGGGSSRRCS